MSGAKVTWVQPVAPSLPSSVATLVQEAVEREGGTILSRHRLHSYNSDERGNLEGVTLSHYVNDLEKFVTVECKVYEDVSKSYSINLGG